MKKIVLTGGGTAGHVTPNLALLPSLRQAGYDITYIGSVNGIEKQLIEAEQIPYFGISSGKLRRYFDLKNFTDPFRVIAGLFQAKKLLRQIRPDVVFSKGGFVSVPVVRAAASLHIPVVGNGDVVTVADAERMMNETGCDAVMVGRATLRNPWIFAGYDFEDVPMDLFRDTCRKHLRYNMEYYGEQWGCVTFRKFAKRYLSRLEVSREDMLKLMTTDDPASFCGYFDALLNGETL